MESLIVLWAIAGWCGTPWRRIWWPWPPPPPEPWWGWRVSPWASAVAGIAAGWAFQQVGGAAEVTRVDAVLSLAPAWLAGAALSGLVAQQAPRAGR